MEILRIHRSSASVFFPPFSHCTYSAVSPSRRVKDFLKTFYYTMESRVIFGAK
ncbi:hypothetical protein CLOSTMETH_03531 [[Clostridium] methylpentosum DSM 5476]|uniref:Uncharacterized protein n=1 Tax=[Clostridium] methylpentosum DSM 5476 TaxID=537013 RepID=C0EI36_9FIRM|nr:hypothetical protein CLOSTMETH_03531 [[Clostridium] methylpentosum DSM 5476]